MGDADYFLSAENELLRYPEAMSEELWSDLAIRMLVGLAERADEDGKVDLYVEASPLETLLHAAGHQRISWILLHQHSFDHPTVDPRNDELFAMLDDGLAAMRSLIEAGDLEIVTVAGDIYFRIANLESMLSESANRPTQDADAVALLRAKAARIRELREMAYDDYLLCGAPAGSPTSTMPVADASSATTRLRSCMSTIAPMPGEDLSAPLI